MTKTDFSAILAIVRKGDRSHTKYLWELGDQLLADIGKPDKEGAKDGSFAKLKELSETLKEQGYDFKVETLRNYRDTAYRFPHNRRYADMSFYTHFDAGHPNTLDMIVNGAPDDQKVTGLYVRKVLRALVYDKQAELDEENDRRRADAYQARKEREAAEEELKEAKTLEERRSAVQKAKNARKREKVSRVAPRVNHKKLAKEGKIEDLALLLARTQFKADVAELSSAVDKLRETWEGKLKPLPDIDLAAGHERTLKIVEKLRRFAEVIRKHQGAGARHLSAVGE